MGVYFGASSLLTGHYPTLSATGSDSMLLGHDDLAEVPVDVETDRSITVGIRTI